MKRLIATFSLFSIFSKKISAECYRIISTMLNMEYASIVDSMDDAFGNLSLNNIVIY